MAGPLVSAGINYDGVAIAKPATRPDLTAAVVTWTPVIAPGNLLVYHGKLFADWHGSALASGLVSEALDRVEFDGHGGARVVARYPLGFRVRDVAEAPDGAVWVLADDDPGGPVPPDPASMSSVGCRGEAVWRGATSTNHIRSSLGIAPMATET